MNLKNLFASFELSWNGKFSGEQTRFIATPLLVLAVGLLSACSTAAWYESVRQAAVNQCDKQAPAARQDCLSQVSQQSYDSYAKERAAK
jgi:hypothetical protein